MNNVFKYFILVTITIFATKFKLFSNLTHKDSDSLDSKKYPRSKFSDNELNNYK